MLRDLEVLGPRLRLELVELRGRGVGLRLQLVRGRALDGVVERGERVPFATVWPSATAIRVIVPGDFRIQFVFSPLGW